MMEKTVARIIESRIKTPTLMKSENK